MTEQQYQEFAHYVDHDNQSLDDRITTLDALRAYTQQFTYAGHADRTARDLIADAYKAQHGSTGKKIDPTAWLADQLATGPRWVADIEDAAGEADITDYRLKSAKKTLRAETKYDGATRKWYWRLLHHPAEPPAAGAGPPDGQGHEQGDE
jgi:hypothetical protein